MTMIGQPPTQARYSAEHRGRAEGGDDAASHAGVADQAALRHARGAERPS